MGALNEREQAFLDAMAASFVYDPATNPNSADAVYREQCAAGETHQGTPLEKAIRFYETLQTADGNFTGDYGGPMFLLPGLVITSYITQSPFPAPHRVLMTRYMLNHQRADGGWGLHLEGHSTMFGTVLQYVALRLLGLAADHPSCVKARAWIHAHGGATYVPLWGKFYLSVLGVYEWDGMNTLFPEFWLLPEALPVHPSRYWCHTRLVYLPMAYCYAVRMTAPQDTLTAALRSELYPQAYHTINWPEARNQCAPDDAYFPQPQLLKMMNSCLNQYEKIHLKSWRSKAVVFMLDYINAEDEQTNYINLGPVNKAMNSLVVYHAYGKDSVQFEQHQLRWYDYLWLAEDGMKMQGYNGSQFWDTAFAVQAVEAGPLAENFPGMRHRAHHFIVQSQLRHEVKDREKYFRQQQKGGWPFSNLEHGWPITDCTAEGLKLLLQQRKAGTVFDDQRFTDACDVLLTYQNKDGGWASYENTRGPKWLEQLNPAELFGNIMIDYSYTECSSAAVQALLKFREQFPRYRKEAVEDAIEKGVAFILGQQRADGSWYGSWAVCFTYGGWFGAAVLRAYLTYYTNGKLVVAAQAALDRHTSFLLSKQMADGGWGESFESCVQQRYIYAEQSQIVNTAWAVMALLDGPDSAASRAAIEKGIQLITSRQLPNGDFPQENISGVFNHNCMITYTSYRNVFPIWAMGKAISSQI